MNADRENNHLPLRAGAMLLLAVAVVALLLGIKSCSDSGKETAHDKLAEQNVASEPAASGTSGTQAPSGTAASTTQTAATPLCILNAGSITGLASEVAEEMKSAGFSIGADPGNLATSSITENTVFYTEGQEDEANRVAAAVPGGATAEERPAAFARCADEIAVIVVSK